MGALWSMLLGKLSGPDENDEYESSKSEKKPRRLSRRSSSSSSQATAKAPVEAKNAESGSNGTSSNDATSSLVPDKDEDEYFLHLPDFGVLKTETEESTPERRCFHLDADVLLARVRWGLQALYVKQVKQLSPFPWKPDLQYNTLEQYVNIEIELMDRSGQRPKRMVPSVANLWDALETEGKDNRPKHMMFRGEAGSGKTTFCHWLLNCWIREIQQINRLNFRFTIMIYYDLKNLKSEDDLDMELLNIMHTYSTLDPRESDLTSKCIRYYNGEIVILLDGYDCLDAEKQAKVKAVLKMTNDKCTELRIATICIISRFETDREILYLFDRQFKFKGFTKGNVDTFLSKHLRSDLPVIKAQVQKYELGKIFDFEGLAPVTILLVADELKSLSDLDGQYDILFRVIMSLARRSHHVDKRDFDETNVKQTLYHLGEWFRICSILKVKDFPEDEFASYLGKDYHIIMRIGIMKKRVNSPLSMERNLEALHIMYWQVLEANYIQMRWLSLSNDSERKHFLEQFQLDKKATVVVFIFRLERTTSRICVRMIGANSNVCFDWTIINNEIAKFAVNLQPFQEFQPEKEIFRINVEFKENNDINAVGLMEVFYTLMSVSKDSSSGQKILDLLYCFPQRTFVVSFSDCAASSSNVSGSCKLLETVPVARLANSANFIGFENMPLVSSLLNASAHLQVNLGHPWTFAKHCNIVLGQFCNTSLLKEDNENLHNYLYGVMLTISDYNLGIVLVLKFKDSNSDLTIILNKEPRKLLICDSVYCSVLHSFTTEEVLKKQTEFSNFEWNKCYRITLKWQRPNL